MTLPRTTEETPKLLRIGELAEQAGVSVATIKFYIREGVLPRPTKKTGRTMGYYDLAYLDKLRMVRTLREEHFLPLRVIKSILRERGDAPMAQGDAALLARLAPSVIRRLDPGGALLTREELRARFTLPDDDLALLEEMGLIGEDGGASYGRADLALLEALEHAEKIGLRRELFPMEGLGHYVELLGELARREVRRFTHQAHHIPTAELERLAEDAVAASEPIITLIRRKLILRALRAELSSPKAKNKKGKEAT